MSSPCTILISLFNYFTLLHFLCWISLSLMPTNSFTLFHFILLTLYVNIYCDCIRCPYSITGCTSVSPWSRSLYVGDCIVMSSVENSIGTVCLDPFPPDVGVWVCSSHFTYQISITSFYHCVSIWYTGLHFWFIWQKSTCLKNCSKRDTS